MPYVTGQNRTAKSSDATLQASTTQTASGNGSAYEMADNGTLRLTLAITAASGTTPSMTVSVDTSTDGSTGWTSVGTFAAQTTTTAGVRKMFTGLDRFARVSWTISGTTPSFTFSVVGEAV